MSYGGATCWSLPAIVSSSGGVLCRAVVPPVGVTPAVVVSSGGVLCRTVVPPVGVYLLLWSPLVVFCVIRWCHLLEFICYCGHCPSRVVCCVVRWCHLLEFSCGCGLLYAVSNKKVQKIKTDTCVCVVLLHGPV